jgi:hypothetical protein
MFGGGQGGAFGEGVRVKSRWRGGSRVWGKRRPVSPPLLIETLQKREEKEVSLSLPHVAACDARPPLQTHWAMDNAQVVVAGATSRDVKETPSPNHQLKLSYFAPSSKRKQHHRLWPAAGAVALWRGAGSHDAGSLWRRIRRRSGACVSFDRATAASATTTTSALALARRSRNDVPPGPLPVLISIRRARVFGYYPRRVGVPALCFASSKANCRLSRHN